MLAHLGWNSRLSPLGRGSRCDLISCGSSRGMMSSSANPESTTVRCRAPTTAPTPSPSPKHPESLSHLRFFFVRSLLFLSKSLWIPLFSKSTSQITKKLPPPLLLPYRHSFIRLSCLPVVSFLSFLISLSLLLSFFFFSSIRPSVPKSSRSEGQKFLSPAG